MDYRVTRVKVTRMMYGWSKYGGARHGLVKHNGEWTCQICGETFPSEIPAYMFCWDIENLREFLRICGMCENKYKKNKEMVKSVDDLIKLCRKPKGIIERLENL